MEGNHPHTSVQEKLLADFLADGEYTLVNTMRGVMKDGPFTRYDPKEPLNVN